MQFVSRQLGRWPLAIAWVTLLAAAVLLPGLDKFGLWEPQERQLADRVAPRPELAKKQTAQPPQAVPKDGCWRTPPKDAVSRSLNTRAMVWGRDTVGDSDAGRRLPFALLGLLTVLATAGLAMRLSGPRAGVVTALVLLSMPLLVFQSRQLTTEIGTAAGAALTLYGFVALGSSRGWIGVIDSVVALASLAAGIAIGFVSGGALLGVLVPVGAYAVSYGLGVAGLIRAGRATGAAAFSLAGRLDAKWIAGRPRPPAPAKTRGYVELGMGVALAIVGIAITSLTSDLASGAVYVVAYGPIVAGVCWIAHGVYVIVTGAPGDDASWRDSVVIVEHVKALLATLFVIAIVAVLAYQLYSLERPQPGLTPPQRAVLGKTVVATGCWSWALGAVWRPEDDLRFGFDSTFEQIAYGTFPWGVLGLVAIGALLSSGERKRRLIGAVSLAWAGGAWVAAEVFQRKVGFTIWAGFPALALAIGAWLDNVLAGRAKGDKGAMPAGAMLVGLFVAFAVLDLGKDMQSFTERISSLLVGADQVPYPKMSRLGFLPTKLWIIVLGGLAATSFAIAMSLWRDEAREGLRKASRTAAGLAIAFTALIAVFWSFAWQPALATHLSSKAMFDTYLELRKQGDQLVIMGDMGDAPSAYAPDAKPETVTSREQIVGAIGRTNRVFAIAPQTELCQLHREIGGKPYFVVDDRNLRSILLSNTLAGATDKNPLRTSILHEEPKQIPIRPKGRIVFDGRIELLGWDLPKRVDRGDKFTVKMFYKVLQPVGGNWRVLFHFDGPLRFNGDHEPIKGRCQTSTWQPGDFIIDTHTVTAGAGAFTPGPYDVWTGFFTGSAPNWKNMTISEVPPDLRDPANTDRVKITTILLD